MTVYNGSVPAGTKLYVGDMLVSPNKLYFAMMQPDGNFATYHGTPGVPALFYWGLNDVVSFPISFPAGDTWYATASSGALSTYLYNPNDPSQAPISGYGYSFNPSSSGNANSHFQLQDNGRLQVVSPSGSNPTWQSPKAADPVSSIDISPPAPYNSPTYGITYDFANQHVLPPSSLDSLTANYTNNTGITQTYGLNLTLNYTDTQALSWSQADSVSSMIKSSIKVSAPGFAESSLETSLTSTVTITNGESTTSAQARTFIATGTITVPAHSTYTAVIHAQYSNADVPYTYVGRATYSTGYSAAVSNSGTFTAGGAALFDVLTFDSTPGSAANATEVPNAFQGSTLDTAASGGVASAAPASTAATVSPAPMAVPAATSKISLSPPGTEHETSPGAGATDPVTVTTANLTGSVYAEVLHADGTVESTYQPVALDPATGVGEFTEHLAQSGDIVQVVDDPTAPTVTARTTPVILSDNPPDVTIGSGSDTLALQISEDAWQGNAQFTISVDGTQVGGVQTVTAQQTLGQIQTFNVKGTYAPGAHAVTINFLNDAYGGSPSADRNLYVTGVSIDGDVVGPDQISAYANGPQSLTFVEPPDAGPRDNVSIIGPTPGSSTPVTTGVQMVSGTETDPTQPVLLDWSTTGAPSVNDNGWVQASVSTDGTFSAPVAISNPGVAGTLYYRVGAGNAVAGWSATPTTLAA